MDDTLYPPASPAVRLLRYLSPGSPRMLLEDGMHISTIATTDDRITDDAGVVTVDVAADVGNARTVILVRLPDGRTQQIIMPSVRSLHGAFSYDVFAQRGLPPASWGSLAADEHVISVGGVERFLGRLALDHSPAASSGRGSDARYADGTTLDFLLAGLAAALPKATQIIARVATVVPIALWSRIAPAVVQALRRTYSYTYNGRSITVKITQVDVRREGEAAFAAIEPRPVGRTLIIDGGGRTINLALFADGAYRSGATIDQMGVEVALDNVDKELIGAGVRPMTLAERIQLQDAMQTGQPFSIVAGNQRIRIDGVARRHFDASAAAAIQEIHAKVKVEAAEHIQAVGGAAYAPFFGATWRAQLPICVLADQPELANAYGALAALGGTVGRGSSRTARARR